MLHEGEPKASCIHSFLVVKFIVQAGSWGRALRAKGTLPSLVK